MFVALDENYKLVGTKHGVAGAIYYCPCCLGPVHFVPAEKVARYFRHSNSIGEIQRQECELYCGGLPTTNEIDLEEQSNGKLRLQLQRDAKTQFSLLFPKLTKEQTICQENLETYFNVIIKETMQQISSVHLMYHSGENSLPVQLCNSYTIKTSEDVKDKEIKEKYHGVYYPFQKPCLLKPVAGKIVHIPYENITIQDEFYIVTRKNLSFPRDIEILETENIDGFILYKCVMDNEYSQDCVSWFKYNLGKNLLSSNYNLDIVQPVKFIQANGLFQIDQANIILNLSFTGKHRKQELLRIKYPNGKIKHLKVYPGLIKLQLPQLGIYQISIALQQGGWLTIERVGELGTFKIDCPNWSINQQEVIFQIREIYGKRFITKYHYPLKCFNGNIKNQSKEIVFDFEDEMVVTIPFLWTIKLKKAIKELNLDFKELLFLYKTQAKLIKVDNLIYENFLSIVKNTNERQLLTFLRSYPNMLPKKFLDR